MCSRWLARHPLAVAPAPPLPPQSPSPPNSPPLCLARPSSHPPVAHTRHGAYSIERLYAYQAYCCQASTCRILAACALAPLPPLAVILALECVPLASPTLGWRANYMVFVRTYLSAVAISSCLVLQAKNILPDLELTRREAGVIAVRSATMHTAMLLLLASQWVFPIPFMIGVGSVPFVLFTTLSVVLTIGLARFRSVPNIRQRFAVFLELAAIQASMTVIYPSFQALFIRQSSTFAQLLAVCVLQLIKLVLKRLLDRHIVSGIDDYKPEIVVFSVDVYHGLYVSACMQAASSPYTKFLIIGMDIAHQALSLHGIRKRVHQIRAACSDIGIHKQAANNLVEVVVELLESSVRLDSHKLANLRDHPILQHCLSDHQTKTLRNIHQSVVEGSPSKPAASTAQAQPSSILPIPLPLPPRPAKQVIAYSDASPSREGEVSGSAAVDDVTQLLEQTLGVLYSCEYLALTEYVECVVPLVYAVYLLAIRVLPNVQFYPQLAALTPHDHTYAVWTILAYAVLELASLVLFHVLIKRQLGVSPLYQLAFVLENQTEMVEGKLFAWVLIVLQFTLTHFGADFSFTFQWVH